MTAVAERVGARAHGTHVKYVIERCRCEPCREANSEYERARRRRKAYGGDYWPWVDAEPVRQHVLSLMTKRGVGARDGLGPKRIAQLSGVSHGTISKLLYGNYRGRPPSKRVRKDTAEKLLAVRPSQAYLLDARPTWRMIGELVAFGLPKNRIATAIGRGCAKSIQLSKKLVSGENARAVAELHWRIYEQAPKFRLICGCNPPYEVLDRIEAQGDEVRRPIWLPHAEWEYPDARRAMLVASRATRGEAPCVVTREHAASEAGRSVARWYPGPEYVPAGAEVAARMVSGTWEVVA